jgi:hypothetical protein
MAEESTQHRGDPADHRSDDRLRRRQAAASGLGEGGWLPRQSGAPEPLARRSRPRRRARPARPDRNALRRRGRAVRGSCVSRSPPARPPAHPHAARLLPLGGLPACREAEPPDLPRAAGWPLAVGRRPRARYRPGEHVATPESGTRGRAQRYAESRSMRPLATQWVREAHGLYRPPNRARGHR